MTNYGSFHGKLLMLAKPYPLYDKNDQIIGYTDVGEMSVITYAEIKNKNGYIIEPKKNEVILGIPFDPETEEGYFEVVITTGAFIGMTIALTLQDIMEASFVFNILQKDDLIYIANREIKYVFI